MEHGTYYKRGNRQFFRPKRSDEVLTNPGMGMETFQAFNGDETTIKRKGEDGPTEFSEFTGNLHNEDFPDTSVAYFRWYWPRIEPEENRYRWDVIDLALERAKQSQQQLHIRLMPHGAGIMIPEWYLKKGSIIEYTCTRSGKKRCIPDYKAIKEINEKSYQLLKQRCKSGAALESLEEKELFYQKMD